jgi:hypothetical protein
MVPDKRAGSYVNCPLCAVKFWVPKEMLAEAAGGETAAATVHGGGGSSSVAVGGGPSSAGRGGMRAEQPPLAPPVPPPTSLPPARTARFISADAAHSTLRLAADGNLPDLHLAEDDNAGAARTSSRALNPWLVFGLVAASVFLSILLVLVDFDPSTAPTTDVNKARYTIEQEYFGGNDPEAPLEPYQQLLREAHRAHVRGDLKTERRCYRRVLEMLRAERRAGERGLTGSRSRDKRLEEQLVVLLSTH